MKLTRTVLAAALAGLASGVAAPLHAQSITGAGASFPNPVYQKWGEAAGKAIGVQLNYQSVGSGAGQTQIKNRTVDFGASDAPLTDAALKEANLMQFPTVMGSVVAIVNVPGVEDGQMRLTGEMLSDIYLGKITKWNDPRLVEMNRGVTLPNLAIAPVYRAELSHTSRHLSEYLSLDVELGFIESENDVMALEETMLKVIMTHVAEHCSRELALLEAEIPDVNTAFPKITLLEARDLVAERYGHQTGGKDLDPEAERLVGRWAKEEHGSDFVFVTNYSQAARPFYTYPDEGGLTRGFDLLFRGLEITSGGQRIHTHAMLVEELMRRKMDPEAFRGYLEVFKYGMPPHGGFAIGAERLTALLLGIPNVRFARAFPRDGSRLQP